MMYRIGVLLLLAGVMDMACRGLVYRTLPEPAQKKMDDLLFNRGGE
ncbi:hypothetical protein [Salimicrobium flavidum]|uniref:Uncharacterized protein n=1 Tax=Salimicrobium flavidum TaxID=570947 RepID=A0A1N7KFG6_9BACI|nr:hypothetical protein [Salimicrobium flavidum]SIS60307.1 hypothetical protein SAMN05421687_11127 [Salimicrobium flavidum]